MRYSGVVSRGIRMSLIKEGTDLVPVIAETLWQASQEEGFVFINVSENFALTSEVFFFLSSNQ